MKFKKLVATALATIFIVSSTSISNAMPDWNWKDYPWYLAEEHIQIYFERDVASLTKTDGHREYHNDIKNDAVGLSPIQEMEKQREKLISEGKKADFVNYYGKVDFNFFVNGQPFNYFWYHRNPKDAYINAKSNTLGTKENAPMPYMLRNTFMFPLETITPYIGATVKKDGNVYTIKQDSKTLHSPEKPYEVTFRVGNVIATTTRDGKSEEFTLTAPAKIEGNFTYVPIIEIMRAMGYKFVGNDPRIDTVMTIGEDAQIITGKENIKKYVSNYEEWRSTRTQQNQRRFEVSQDFRKPNAPSETLVLDNSWQDKMFLSSLAYYPNDGNLKMKEDFKKKMMTQNYLESYHIPPKNIAEKGGVITEYLKVINPKDELMSISFVKDGKIIEDLSHEGYINPYYTEYCYFQYDENGKSKDAPERTNDISSVDYFLMHSWFTDAPMKLIENPFKGKDVSLKNRKELESPNLYYESENPLFREYIYSPFFDIKEIISVNDYGDEFIKYVTE